MRLAMDPCHADAAARRIRVVRSDDIGKAKGVFMLSRAIQLLSFAALGLVACSAAPATDRSESARAALAAGEAESDAGGDPAVDAEAPPPPPATGCVWCTLVSDGTFKCDAPDAPRPSPPPPKGTVCTGTVKCKDFGNGQSGYGTADCEALDGEPGQPRFYCPSAGACVNAPPLPPGPLPPRAVPR